MVEDDRSFYTHEGDGPFAGNVVSAEDYEKYEKHEKEEEVKEQEEETKLQNRASSVLAFFRGIFHGLVIVIAATLKICGGLIVLVLGIHAYHNLFSRDLSAAPRSDLTNFVLSKKNAVSAELGAIGSMETDSFHSFSATICLEGSSLQRTRDALALGLDGVPLAVRDKLVMMALQEGISAKNSWMNSTVDFDVSNTAHSYMAFYSTD
jgi:hypothetical protein